MAADQHLVGRWATPLVAEYLDTFRVIVVGGPRQAGKSTLLGFVPSLAGQTMTLDSPDALELAANDPVALLGNTPRPFAIDEYQRAGDPLLLALKQVVDGSQARGQFVLAGSTNFLTNRRLSDTLAGRVGLVEVWPLSVGETAGRSPSFLDAVFDDPADLGSVRAAPISRAELADLMCRGGYPEVVTAPTGRARTRLLRGYADTVTSRHVVADVADARRLPELRRMLRLLMARTAQEVNLSALTNELDVHRATIDNYLAILGDLYQIVLLPAWSTNATSRVVKRPKIHSTDTGLCAALLGVDTDALRRLESPWFGPLLESFVTMELVKQRQFASRSISLYHYRDRNGPEVDIIAEASDGTIVGIEVKSSATPRSSAFDPLRAIRDRLGDRFRCGVVLHTGTLAAAAGDRLWSLPVSSLWA